MQIFDRQRPQPAALTIDFGNTSPSFELSLRSLINASSATGRWVDRPLLVYVRDRNVFQVPLTRASTSASLPAPARVSALADACAIESLFELDTSGNDAIALIRTAGTDNVCGPSSTNRGDDQLALLRVGSTPSVNATLLSAATRSVSQPVTDATGNLLWLLGFEDIVPRPVFGFQQRAVAYSPALVRTDVSGGGGVFPTILPISGPLGAEGLWLGTSDDQGVEGLALLRGSASTLSITPGVATVASNAGTNFAIDGSVVYATDGLTVVRVERNGTRVVLSSLDGLNGEVRSLRIGGDSIFIRQINLAGVNTLVLLPKSGGAGRVLFQRPSSGDGAVQILSVTATKVLYLTEPGTQAGSLRSLDVVTGNDTLVEAAVFFSGTVISGEGALNVFNSNEGFLGLMFCRPAAGRADCRGGELLQIDANTLAVTVLGRLPELTTPAQLSLSASGVTSLQQGNATLFATTTSPATRISDNYVFEPGVAGSLVRVTQTIP